MTKAEIVEIVAEKTGFTAKDIKVVVEQCITEIKNCLAENEHLEIRGFGTFKVRERKARKARNPRSGAEVLVPAKLVPVFKSSNELKAMVRG